MNKYRKNDETSAEPASNLKKPQLAASREISFSEETKTSTTQAKLSTSPSFKSAKQPAKSAYKSTRQNPIIVDIEEIMGCPIEKPILHLLEQQIVPKMHIMKAYTDQSRNVSKA